MLLAPYTTSMSELMLAVAASRLLDPLSASQQFTADHRISLSQELFGPSVTERPPRSVGSEWTGWRHGCWYSSSETAGAAGCGAPGGGPGCRQR